MTKYRIVKRERKRRGGDLEIDYFIERSYKILFLFTIWTVNYELDSQRQAVVVYSSLPTAEAKKKALEENALWQYNQKITKVTEKVL